MTEITSSPTAAPEETEVARVLPTFDLLPLSRELKETLAEMGYVNPTPVQLAVWEPVTRGKDAVVQARTGTGKTAAFGLPIVDHIVKRSQAHAQVLALCPTRELALQVAAEVERLGKKKGVKVVAVYGGAPMPRQVEAIAGGAQVIVGTPGRVLDHLRRGTLDPKGIRLLVLDESDEMLSMGFERELTSILETLPPDRQTVLFSATVPPDIERIARTRLKTPEFITLSGDHIGALEILHFVYMVAADKLGALVRMIEVENPESAVVFCNTKDETERVAQALQRQGFDADWLNGDLPQSDREKVMSATREGRLRFLVATDVAARGIDISHLTHVINHDFPQDAESYVHRTGRTGRAGRTGTAISLITPRDIGGLYLLRLTYKIRPIEKQIPTPGELKTRAEADLVAMLAEAFAAKGTHPDDLTLARRLLSHDQCEAIVAGLLRDHLGVRPTSQDEASAARRATRPARPVRGMVRSPRAPLPAPTPPPAAPAASPAPDTPRVSGAAASIVSGGSTPASPIAAAPAPLPPAAPPPRPRDEARGVEVRGQAPDRARAGEAPAEGGRRRRGRDDDRRDETREPRRDARPERGPVDPGAPIERSEISRGSGGLPPGSINAAPARSPRERAPGEATATTDRRPAGAGRASPTRGARHADFVTWQPPEEEGDDQPILGAGQDRAPAAPDTDFTEIYVNVGRRDGARAADIQRVLQERGSLDKDDVRRIRVRERNAFVSVRKQALAGALAALTGAEIGGRSVLAEQARERSGEGEGHDPDAAAATQPGQRPPERNASAESSKNDITDVGASPPRGARGTSRE